MRYLGIDVSKAKLDCCLLDETGQKPRHKVVANSDKGIAALLDWLQKQQAPVEKLHAVMEGTGVYHEQAALGLYDSGVVISIVNPAQAKDFGKGLAIKTKTDKADALVLAKYGQLAKPAAWEAPPAHARELQALLSRREALAQDLRRELNRQEKAEATQTSALILQSLKDSIAFIDSQLKKLEKDIDEHIDRHPDLKEDKRLLKSIPAVGDQVSHHILSVFHRYHFRSAEQLASYLGLVPVERQSGSSVHGRARLSKAGPSRVRAVLYMAAIVATRYNPHVRALYERLLMKGKSKMSALGAAMRKLVHLCFGVMKTRQPYSAVYAA